MMFCELVCGALLVGSICLFLKEKEIPEDIKRDTVCFSIVLKIILCCFFPQAKLRRLAITKGHLVIAAIFSTQMNGCN